MNLLAHLLSPLALLWSTPQPDVEARLSANAASLPPVAGENYSWLQAAAPPFRVPEANQVRIERRVFLGISPIVGTRQSLAAVLDAPRRTTRLAERSFADCLPVANIAAVQARSGSRLLLYLRDRRLLAADLEKACLAENFYSGFYLEPNADGRLCVSRDKLQSRSGAKCSISSLRQIVAISAE